jgi:SAM-dependent methyltransferase
MPIRLKRILAGLGLLAVAVRVRDVLWTARFWRANARYWREGAADGLPIPPFSLRILVAASPDISWFLESGRRAAESIRATLARKDLDIADMRAVLDFGCGCGRVIRHWAALGAELHGSDLNPTLIYWCGRNLGFGRFATNGPLPPLPYVGGQFDFAYSLSVFTHMPETAQEAWMGELARVLRPGGHLLVTTHGERYVGQLTGEERSRFAAGQLVVRNEDRPGSNVCGAYHPESYVRERLARGFRVLEFIPEGAAGNPYQDVYLLRRV